MTSKQRSYLKSMAQTLEPTFQIGKNGVTPELVTAISESLEKRELLKVSVLNNCDLNPKDIMEMLSARTQSVPVQVIGKKLVIFKPSKNNPKITLPKA
ncbi:MAG: RNA-binding protein [Epulopiscium sp. Nele67-Bin005]|nr:MAG: RNA-binding protein [Epulopiscium sp. Nele67-Bin005]